MEDKAFGIKPSESVEDIINCLIYCYEDIEKKKEDSVFYKECGSLQLFSSLINHVHQMKNETKVECPIDMEVLSSNFSTLKQQVQCNDEMNQELQYKYLNLQKQLEKQNSIITNQQKRIHNSALFHRNPMS